MPSHNVVFVGLQDLLGEGRNSWPIAGVWADIGPSPYAVKGYFPFLGFFYLTRILKTLPFSHKPTIYPDGRLACGRIARQPGQSRKEAALTRPLWVARPASHL